jgi:hypothetical protein
MVGDEGANVLTAPAAAAPAGDEDTVIADSRRARLGDQQQSLLDAFRASALGAL